ncbi:MAG: transcriptional repressor LexA [Gammaproteobacteria bacterium]
MLTESQFKTLQVIKRFVLEHGYAPTIAQITSILGLKSRSAIHRNLHRIAEAGHIRLIPNKRRNIELLDANTTSLPLLGKIAAGRPIEAVEDQRVLNVADRLLGANRFVLEVCGDSMIEDNICDGDYVICEQANTAANGAIVVALVDNQEATLKRFYNNADGTVTLMPANASMKPMKFPGDNVQIQGLFVGLLRFQ